MKSTGQRHSLRLRDHDYRSAGAYFVTICSFQRECLFGQVVAGEVRLTPYGEIVREEWLNTVTLRPNVELDAFVVMPNHIHGILVVVDDNDDVGAHCCAPDRFDADMERAHVGAPLRRTSGSIGSIIAGFKSVATKRINAVRDNPGCPVWQRNYFDRVIRNEREMANVRQYIVDNPAQWDLDENNPINGEKFP